MSLDVYNDLTGDIVVKSGMSRSFDKFRVILQEQELENFFRASFFGFYLDFPGEIGVRFQITMVYGLMKHRFLYTTKDKLIPLVMAVTPANSSLNPSINLSGTDSKVTKETRHDISNSRIVGTSHKYTPYNKK
ncbi:hypothetical protein RND71_015555 [Anisodus tanguticus]|uniref:Uncharacterized protein n=1 Tax=Anisodus tanguticus TaxID=243964 RepID=A0AAE1S6Q3_9SOLA|nr:hypothetical protein RND71_015555 [Anisodus tanguticus]